MDNVDSSAKRFDIYCRSEKFFSATLLSYIFLFNKFEGIKMFFGLLKNNNIISENNHISLCHNFNHEQIHYATEVNLYRDFSYHKVILNEQAYINKPRKESTPDIVFVYKNYIFIIECKVYMNCSSNDINEQLIHQKYLFDMIKCYYNDDKMNCIHIAIIPDNLKLNSGVVITWKQIMDHYNSLINENHYLKSIFKNNIDHLYKYY